MVNPWTNDGRKNSSSLASDRTLKSQRKRSLGQGVGGQGFTRLPDEHAVLESEVRLKGASGGQGHEVLCPRHVSRGREKAFYLKNKKKLVQTPGFLAK